jgi:hypothetical protein
MDRVVRNISDCSYHGSLGKYLRGIGTPYSRSSIVRPSPQMNRMLSRGSAHPSALMIADMPSIRSQECSLSGLMFPAGLCRTATLNAFQRGTGFPLSGAS